MKYLQLTLVLFLTQLLFAQTPESAKKTSQPPLRFTVLEIERQNIPYGSEDLFVFEFKNTSKKPAVITNVQTSCGCTAADRPEAPIRKGKKGVIKVHYDTKRVGAFTKTITVFSNVGDPIVLTIKGTVLTPSDSPVTN
ncbi:MAG: hypothetical protein RLZZ211_224 [Bacteroidota bacterium]|jgi:hypothetical protein